MILVIGILSAIGGSIGSQTMAIVKLRATAERLTADIKAQRELSMARGSIVPAGTTIGIHFFNKRLDNGNATAGNSYVPFGLMRNRPINLTRPLPADVPLDNFNSYAQFIVNLPRGTRIRMGNPSGVPPTPMLENRAGGLAFSMGFMDGLSVGPFRVIELSDDSITGFFRITMSGLQPLSCGNPILTFETP